MKQKHAHALSAVRTCLSAESLHSKLQMMFVAQHNGAQSTTCCSKPMRHSLHQFLTAESQINQRLFQLLARLLPTYVANPLRSLRRAPHETHTLRFPALLRSV
jgi:hypothetical protein